METADEFYSTMGVVIQDVLGGDVVDGRSLTQVMTCLAWLFQYFYIFRLSLLRSLAIKNMYQFFIPLFHFLSRFFLGLLDRKLSKIVCKKKVVQFCCVSVAHKLKSEEFTVYYCKLVILTWFILMLFRRF